MKDTLNVFKTDALHAYENASSKEARQILEDLFGKDTFICITERIKTFQDVLDALKMDSEEVFEECWLEAGLTIDEIAYKKLKLITHVLNEGWKANSLNRVQSKYYPRFDFSGAGQACVDSDAAPSGTYASYGSRLCFKSRELALYAGRTFFHIYKDCLQ